jgi:hypothetical protein
MPSKFLKGLYIGTVVGVATTEIARNFTDNKNTDNNDIIIKNLRDRESLQLLVFYDNKCSTYENPSHLLDEIQSWTMYSENWTNYTGYIQWMFPIPFVLKGGRKHNNKDLLINSFYPLLNKSTALHLRGDYYFNEKFKKNISQFLMHLGIKRNGVRSTIDDYYVFDETTLKHWNSNKQIHYTNLMYLIRVIFSIRSLMVDNDADIADVLAYTLFKLSESGIIADIKNDASHYSVLDLWKAALMEPVMWSDGEDNTIDYDFIHISTKYSKISNRSFLKFCRRRFYNYIVDKAMRNKALKEEKMKSTPGSEQLSISTPKSDRYSTSSASDTENRNVDDLNKANENPNNKPSFFWKLLGY